MAWLWGAEGWISRACGRSGLRSAALAEQRVGMRGLDWPVGCGSALRHFGRAVWGAHHCSSALLETALLQLKGQLSS